MKVDFFITGVMKGGTTALYDFITEHPDVNKASQKEIHYFTLNYDKGDEWYSSFFTQNGKINGEASPTYFDLATSKTIPTMINRHNSDSKVIVILRNPVERAISHFNHLVKVNKNKNLEDLGIERFFNLPYSDAITACNEMTSLLYHVLNFSCYSQKLSIFKSEFGERLLVLQNEDLLSNPKEVMSKVYTHIGVDPNFYSDEFEQFKYSSGTTSTQLSDETYRKLEEFFNDDFNKTKSLIESFQ